MAVSSSLTQRPAPAGQLVADLFRAHRWVAKAPPRDGSGADLIIQRGKQRFIVKVKALSESRPDRVLPMLSLAILQAKAAAEAFGNAQPLAVVHVPGVPATLAKQVEEFARQFARDVSVGLVSGRGEHYFSGSAFQALNRLPEASRRVAAARPRQAVNLFSDLNQWMLKLLLAPEVPKELLNAPRALFRTGADLAEAAQVSAMSASRFLQQLRSEGYLSESYTHLGLVRREELFRRWGAATMRTPLELPCRFLLRAPIPQQLQQLLDTQLKGACLGLFAAADELRFGHVSGVPSHVYVRQLPRLDVPHGAGLLPNPIEPPDLVLRQAQFPESTFRGAVHRNGLVVTDLIQTWLDVMHHPARGAEQAALIYRQFLAPIAKR